VRFCNEIHQLVVIESCLIVGLSGLDILVTVREGIKSGTLDDVERKYIHPSLKDSLDNNIGSSSIGE
jgi:hypothetical protein